MGGKHTYATGVRPSGWRMPGTGSVRRDARHGGGWYAYSPQRGTGPDRARQVPIAGPFAFKHQATAALDAWLRERGGEG